MRSLELSGVIGTWAAVALALIALIGVLPIYIGYRKRLSTWAKQIAKIDDPNQNFVAKGWPGLPGQRFFSRVQVPNLLDPPNIASIHIERKQFSGFWPRESQSHTGWVNFLNILRSYDAIKLDPRSDGELEIVDGELMLPIHRSWILLLGLVDRYSKRPDYGLFAEESREPQVRFRFGSHARSGLSGVLSLVTSDQDEERGSEQDIICFHMHRLSQIRRLSSEAADGDYSLPTLLFLFLGYIPALNGSIYLAETPSTTDSHHTRRMIDMEDREGGEKKVWEFKEMETSALPQLHAEIFDDLQVNISKVHMLQGRTMKEEEEEKYVSSGPAAVYYELRAHSGNTIFIRRTDSNTVLREVMKLGCNNQSFLHAHIANEREVALIFSVLGRKGLNSSIRRALDAPKDSKQRSLETAMEESLRTLSTYRQPGPWSRSLWTGLSNLQREIMRSCSDKENPYMLAISVLFAIDEDFREVIKSHDGSPLESRKRIILTLDFAKNAIRCPRLQDTKDTDFSFDFASFFQSSDTRQPTYSSNEQKEVLYADAAIACLRSHIVMAMWSMCIPAHDLFDLYTNLEPTVYVSARTLPRRRRSRFDRDYSPVRRDANRWHGSDDGSGDWSDEDASRELRRLPEAYKLYPMPADGELARVRLSTIDEENEFEYEVEVIRRDAEGRETWIRIDAEEFQDFLMWMREKNT